jgi:hypothetical protein
VFDRPSCPSPTLSSKGQKREITQTTTSTNHYSLHFNSNSRCVCRVFHQIKTLTQHKCGLTSLTMHLLYHITLSSLSIYLSIYLSMNKYPPSTQTISFLLSSFYLCFVSRYSLSSSFLFLKVLLFLLIICMSIEKSFKLFNT